MHFRLIVSFLLVMAGSGLVMGQGAGSPPTPGPAAVPMVSEERNLAALEAVAEPLAKALREVERLTAELRAADTLDARNELEKRIAAEREQIGQYRASFRTLVGDPEARSFEPSAEEKQTLQEQFTELLEPLVGALREPTERLREVDDMRKARAAWQDQERKAASVIARIDSWMGKSPQELVNEELNTTKRVWLRRQGTAASNAEILRLQLEEREQNSPTIWESISSMFTGFWKTRGINVLLGVFAAVAAYIAVRKSYLVFRKVSPLHRKRSGGLLSRISDVVSVAVAVMIATTVILMVWYVRGDWLLLTLAAVLLIGIVWAGKTALPPYIEQIRMLLNLGAVREGERLVYRGLPWEVTSLRFYTIFTNPALSGGRLRIPLREVMGMISRTSEPNEPWFPSHPNDWVILRDGTFGQVMLQTPEQVVMMKRGGSVKTFPTAEYLDLMPESLSRGFRVRSPFRVDYCYQQMATTIVADELRTAVRAAIVGEFGESCVRDIRAEILLAGESWIDIQVIADLTGEVAARYNYLSRLIQKCCVETSNRKGWIIPFPQLTLHQRSENLENR